MIYYRRIQKAIDYIELNLKEDIDVLSIAKVSCFSVTHFYRIFQAMVGDSVKRYIQKRRLSDAAIELIKSNKRLIDVAFEYRYNSQEVFTRAFSRAFGITPGRYRAEKNKLVLYQKANVHQKILANFDEGIFIDPKIILDKEFKMVGMKNIVKPGSKAIKKLWDNFNLRKSEIKNVVKQDSVLGLCEYMPDITDDSEFYYCVMTEVTDFYNTPKGMISKTIPHSKYAVFAHKGSLVELKNTYSFIYGVWLPHSGYELAELDTFELYGSNSTDNEYELDIYIPLR